MTDAPALMRPSREAPLAQPSIRRPSPGAEDARMRAAAVGCESMFLAEMLTAAGVGRPPEGFGGGVGEQAFTGLLVREQARLWAERGGIGLAESIYRSLVRDAAAT